MLGPYLVAIWMMASMSDCLIRRYLIMLRGDLALRFTFALANERTYQSKIIVLWVHDQQRACSSHMTVLRSAGLLGSPKILGPLLISVQNLTGISGIY